MAIISLSRNLLFIESLDNGFSRSKSISRREIGFPSRNFCQIKAGRFSRNKEDLSRLFGNALHITGACDPVRCARNHHHRRGVIENSKRTALIVGFASMLYEPVTVMRAVCDMHSDKCYERRETDTCVFTWRRYRVAIAFKPT